MNTKNKQDQKKQRQRTRQAHGLKKRGQNPSVHQEHEHPEMRLTR
jgi:hypothetical protein